MPATEQLHRLFEQAFNAGDLEALMDLYESDAAPIPQPGVTVAGATVSAMRSVVPRLPGSDPSPHEARDARQTSSTSQPVVADRRHDARREPSGTWCHHRRSGSPRGRLQLA